MVFDVVSEEIACVNNGYRQNELSLKQLHFKGKRR